MFKRKSLIIAILLKGLEVRDAMMSAKKVVQEPYRKILSTGLKKAFLTRDYRKSFARNGLQSTK